MPVSLTTPANDTAPSPQNRANRLAALLTDMLADAQTKNGDFPQHGFYATAFAIALWHGLDPGKYQAAITQAIHALQKQDDGKKYHREFIEFALSQTMALHANQRRAILRHKAWQNAWVGNWLILRMVCLEKGGVLSRLAAKVLWRFIDGKFRDGAAFLDRPGCFSAQYHAFCAALLTFSQQPACQQAGLDAAKLINDIMRQSGHVNLIGRGAGQSFGIISAIYALLHAGFDRPAEKLLDQIEQSLLAHQNLPLNLLAAPSDDAANARRKPGWYSYNRHYDYLAFAGFFLMRAGQLPERKAATLPQTSKPIVPIPAPKIFRITCGETYCAQMTLAGKSPYDVAPMPVVTSAQGDIILPPCGGEQDFISPYNSRSLPLPILLPAPKGVLRCATPSSAMYQDDTFLMPFKIGGYAGQREIRFSPFEIIFTDQILASNQPDDTDDIDNPGLTARLFRLFIPQNLVAERQSETCIIFPQQGLQVNAATTLQLTPSHHFSALGRVQVLFCQLPYAPETGCCATLTMRWQRGDK